MATKFIYAFSDYEDTVSSLGKENLKAVLGVKGENLAELTYAGANVPKGFTISTELCREFYKQDPPAVPEGFWDELKQSVEKLEEETEKKMECGEGEKPLILSARYGGEVPLQKTCLTFLNIGFNDAAVAALAAATEDMAAWYWGQYFKYVINYATVILKVDPEMFKEAIDAAKAEKGVADEMALDAESMEKLVNAIKEVLENAEKPFPQDAFEQLKAAVEAVLVSWGSPEAKEFREANNVPEEKATAVHVMVQVFGNMGDASGSGVYITRNPANGDSTTMMGSWLQGGIGNEFLAKTKPPQPIATLESAIPAAIDKIHEQNQKLEKHFKDIQKVDFTIENGELYVLQSRTSKRTPAAGLKVHVDFVNEGVMTKEECVQRTTLAEVEAYLRPCFKGEDLRPFAEKKVQGKGICPGVAVGRVCFSLEKVQEAAQEETPVKGILVVEDIDPKDYPKLLNLPGLVTSAGLESHAVNFAKQRKIIGVAGCEWEFNTEENYITISEKVIKEGDMISIDGGSGDIYLGEVPISKIDFEEGAPDLQQILTWADEVRKAEHNTQIYANADTEEEIKNARIYGAEGIGLLRMESLLTSERIELLQKFIFTDKEEKKKEAMQEFEESMAAEFSTLLEAAPACPTVIRLIDQPIQNFLPDVYQLIEEVSVMETKKELGIELEPHAEEETKPEEEKKPDPEPQPEAKAEEGEEGESGEKNEEEEKKEEEEEQKEPPIDPLQAKTEMLEKVQRMFSVNPALGARGIRSSLCIPGLLRAQLKCVIEGASLAAEKGAQPMVEVLIPFATSEQEIELAVQELEASVQELAERRENQTEIKLGAMIEVPRAAYIADRIAKHVDIISFGANELTEGICGYTREEAEKHMIPHYRELGVYADSPFETIDVDGTGRIIEIGLEAIRKDNPDASISICGDQLGDPRSLEYLTKLNFSYISCPPAILPYTRLSAAQTALAQKKEDEPEPEAHHEEKEHKEEEQQQTEEEEEHETDE